MSKYKNRSSFGFESNQNQLEQTLMDGNVVPLEVDELLLENNNLLHSVFSFLCTRERALGEQIISSFIENFGSRDILRFR